MLIQICFSACMKEICTMHSRTEKSHMPTYNRIKPFHPWVSEMDYFLSLNFDMSIDTNLGFNLN